MFVDTGEASWNVVSGQKYWLVMVGSPTALLTAWENTTGATGTLVSIEDGLVCEDCYSPDSTMPALALEVNNTAPCSTPTIDVAPQPVTVCPLSTAQLTVQAGGSGPRVFQWQAQLPPIDGGDWVNLGDGNLVVSDSTNPGHNMVAGVAGCAGGATFTFTPAANFENAYPDMEVQFRVVVRNFCDETISDPVVVTVQGLGAADLNGDGRVDLTDLATLLAHFGLTSGATPADGDTDGDSDVDLSDLTTLLGRFGASCS